MSSMTKKEKDPLSTVFPFAFHQQDRRRSTEDLGGRRGPGVLEGPSESVCRRGLQNQPDTSAVGAGEFSLFPGSFVQGGCFVA